MQQLLRKYKIILIGCFIVLLVIIAAVFICVFARKKRDSLTTNVFTVQTTSQALSSSTTTETPTIYMTYGNSVENLLANESIPLDSTLTCNSEVNILIHFIQ